MKYYWKNTYNLTQLKNCVDMTLTGVEEYSGTTYMEFSRGYGKNVVVRRGPEEEETDKSKVLKNIDMENPLVKWGHVFVSCSAEEKEAIRTALKAVGANFVEENNELKVRL